jgi:hypothetical protein
MPDATFILLALFIAQSVAASSLAKIPRTFLGARNFGTRSFSFGDVRLPLLTSHANSTSYLFSLPPVV